MDCFNLVFGSKSSRFVCVCIWGLQQGTEFIATFLFLKSSGSDVLALRYFTLLLSWKGCWRWSRPVLRKAWFYSFCNGFVIFLAWDAVPSSTNSHTSKCSFVLTKVSEFGFVCPPRPPCGSASADKLFAKQTASYVTPRLLVPMR